MYIFLTRRWSGHGALTDNAIANKQQALQRRAQAANQNFGKFSNNFGFIAKQIRDEALRNSVALKDDAKYRRSNVNSARGANQANARKTQYDKGDFLDDAINYAFSKKFDKSSSENGGFEEENSRKRKDLKLIDEREKDRKLISNDEKIQRSHSDGQKAAKDSAWKSNAAQRQGQQSAYGSSDQRKDQAGERSDDRTLDFDRKDSKYVETEKGRDEAVRKAQDVANQVAGYSNEADADALSNRKVNDKKYYGGKEVGRDPAYAGHEGGYGPDNAVEAVNAVSADKQKLEGSGGIIYSGFDENARQSEKGKELSAANARSSAEAINDYQRNKDKLAFDQVRGLHDQTQGQFKQGLQDASSKGYSGNNAEAAKSAAEWDQTAAAAQSRSDLDAKEKKENEALRERSYSRKIKNDDNETFLRRKQFYHNKKEGGNNDEKLKYNRKKNARNFGAADEADLSKQNAFENLHQDGKVSSQTRDFEDSIDRRVRNQQENEVRQGEQKGFEDRNSRDQAEGHAESQNFVRQLAKSNKDENLSSLFNRRQSLHDEDDSSQTQQENNQADGKESSAKVQHARSSNSNPLGEVRAKTFIDHNLLQPDAAQKGIKEHNLPNVVVKLEPIPEVSKIRHPIRSRPIPPLPEIRQVKSFSPPKHSKQNIDYNTGRATRRGFQAPNFSGIGRLPFFQGQRKNTFSPNRKKSPGSRFNFRRIGRPRAATTFGASNLLTRGATFGNGFSNNIYGR